VTTDPLDPRSRVFIRGSSPKLAIDMLKKRGTLDAVAARMGPEAFGQIAAVGESAWVPMTLYAPFVHAIYEIHGNSHAAAAAFWREHGRLIMASQLLKGIVATARALFGFSPMAIFKIAPRAWTLTYKNFGKMAVTVNEKGREREALMRISGAPPWLCEGGWFPVGHVGTFWAILDLFNTEGTAEMSELDAATGSFTVRVRYNA
jgi:hypothetical protein